MKGARGYKTELDPTPEQYRLLCQCAGIARFAYNYGLARKQGAYKVSRAISDIGLGEFKRQLLYKSAQAGIEIKQVSRWFPSSKTCSSCGNVKEELALSERVYVCVDCGYVADRDYNAAKVLAATA